MEPMLHLPSITESPPAGLMGREQKLWHFNWVSDLGRLHSIGENRESWELRLSTSGAQRPNKSSEYNDPGGCLMSDQKNNHCLQALGYESFPFYVLLHYCATFIIIKTSIFKDMCPSWSPNSARQPAEATASQCQTSQCWKGLYFRCTQVCTLNPMGTSGPAPL
jgi:hypothetical protein